MLCVCVVCVVVCVVCGVVCVLCVCCVWCVVCVQRVCTVHTHTHVCTTLKMMSLTLRSRLLCTAVPWDSVSPLQPPSSVSWTTAKPKSRLKGTNERTRHITREITQINYLIIIRALTLGVDLLAHEPVHAHASSPSGRAVAAHTLTCLNR